MADKNKNGIEDQYEKKAVIPSNRKKPAAPKAPDKNILSYGQETRPTRPAAVSENSNWITDRMRDWSNLVGDVASPFRRNVVGGGYGDYLLGANPKDVGGLLGKYPDGSSVPGKNNLRRGFLREKPSEQQAPQADMTLADYLKMATSLIGQGGSGGVPMANYDPQRNTLRANAAENDARLEAMYRQLRGSIDADAPVIQQGYQQAIDSTAQNSATAQQQTQAATDSSNARNNEVLANLGIQQAQGNIIQNGTDLNSQTARQIGDQATRGQAAGDRLVSNQATALTHNTNIGNAAGLEGNLQRASNNAKLNALLAEIGMQEEQVNADRTMQNASMNRNGLGQQLELAQWMMGNAKDDSRYQDKVQMDVAEIASKQQPAYDPNYIWQWMKENGLSIPEGTDPRDQAALLNAYRQLAYGSR